MKFCKNCGKEMDDFALSCPACGSSSVSGDLYTPAKTNNGSGLGLASMICGIASMVLFPLFALFIGIFAFPLLSIPAIICGAMAKKRGTRGTSTAGIITGILALLGWIVYVAFIVVVLLIIGSSVGYSILGTGIY